MKNYYTMVALFEKANKAFLKVDSSLFSNDVSERTLCAALMYHLRKMVDSDSSYLNYYADVEYNHNGTSVKTIINSDFKVVPITCDLILHSRGKKPTQDNLIAVEMKKSNRPEADKQSDRERLIAMTKQPHNDVWPWNGGLMPEHVCGYLLGVYYEVDYSQEVVFIEYYRGGQKCKSYALHFV